jgi:hypothetical protein
VAWTSLRENSKKYNKVGELVVITQDINSVGWERRFKSIRVKVCKEKFQSEQTIYYS